MHQANCKALDFVKLQKEIDNLQRALDVSNAACEEAVEIIEKRKGK